MTKIFCQGEPSKKNNIIDVTFLLEGTYPYVRGGVSSWVHQLIRGLPDFQFAVIFIGSSYDEYSGFQYKLPENAVYYDELFLLDNDPKKNKNKSNKLTYNLIQDLHKDYTREDYASSDMNLSKLASKISKSNGLSLYNFLNDQESWELIRECYQNNASDQSFLDYFWTVRAMHIPLFKIIDFMNQLPQTRLFHSISTGFAGFLGGMASHAYNTPFLLSEHGIYTKERKIDIAQAKWIKDPSGDGSASLGSGIGHTRQSWIQFFERLGGFSYRSAARITALYSANSDRQQSDGAPSERCLVIPNGIDIDKFKSVRVSPNRTIPKVLGLLGRIVPIKDIKNFIRAIKAISYSEPELEGWIIGPTDEDEEYASECRNLVSSLGLTNNIKFLGFQKTEAILPQLGLLTLSSISEGQPLVILEAFAAGIPAITTDVGNCADLIHGTIAEDRSLGSAGSVVPIADPEALASAALFHLQAQEWIKSHHTAIERVERYYGQELMFERYRQLYKDISNPGEACYSG